jgi:fibronectin-binding autotransporter adhesin
MSPMLIARGLSASLIALILTSTSASAQNTYTWTGGDTDNNWFSPLNWSAVGPGPQEPSPPPVTSITNTFVILSGNTRLTNTLDYSFSANSLTFGAAAGAFVVGTTTSETLTLGVGGITVVAGNPNNQTFNANLALGAGQIWANNGSGTFTVGGAIDTGGFTLTAGGSGNSTYSGVISGAGSVTKTGAGILTLGGTNTFTGVVQVAAGTLRIAQDANLGAAPAAATTGAIVLDGGTLRATNTFTLNTNRGIALGASGGTISIASGQTVTYGGIMAGSGSLTVTGPGKITLGGNSTWTGPLVVNGGGTVGIDNQTSLNSSATAPITLNNGTIEETNPGANGTFTPVGRNISLGAGGGTLSYTTAGTLIIVQTGTVISGTAGGALNKAGAGIIAVVTPATYDGPTNVLEGTLRVRINNNVFPIGTALSVSSGATFDLDTRNQQVGSLAGAGTVNVAGGTFTVGNATSTTFGGAIANSSGAGKVTKVGSGTLTLTGANTYTGTTTVSAGTLTIGTGGSLANSAVTVLNGAVLAGTGAVNGTVAVGAGGIIRGSVSGIGTLTVANSVTVNSGSTLNGTIRFEANRTGVGAAESSKIALSGAGILNLDPGTGNEFTLELVKTGATSSLNYNEQYSLVLATVGTGGDIQFNGVTAPATIGQSDYVLQSPAFAFDPNYTLTVVSDGSGKSLVLTFTPVPEPAAVVGLSCAALGAVGFVGRRLRRLS